MRPQQRARGRARERRLPRRTGVQVPDARSYPSAVLRFTAQTGRDEQVAQSDHFVGAAFSFLRPALPTLGAKDSRYSQ